MPFTIAHSVAAKPIHSLSRGKLPLAGLAVGAMAPDFEYMVHLSAHRTIGHTIPGLFVLCLPSALLVLFVWHRLVGPVLATLLRPGTGGLTNDWDRPRRFGPPAHFAWLCASIVIGSFSHLTWDAFTHEGGVVVNLWSGFSHNLGPGWFPVYRWLQYGCSLFGMAVLGVWAHRASQRPPRPGDVAEGDGGGRVRDGVIVLSRTRRAVTAAVVGGLVLMGAVGSVQGAGQGDILDVVKGAIIGALAGALVSLTVSCAALTRRSGMGRVDVSTVGRPRPGQYRHRAGWSCLVHSIRLPQERRSVVTGQSVSAPASARPAGRWPDQRRRHDDGVRTPDRRR